MQWWCDYTVYGIRLILKNLKRIGRSVGVKKLKSKNGSRTKKFQESVGRSVGRSVGKIKNGTWTEIRGGGRSVGGN